MHHQGGGGRIISVISAYNTDPLHGGGIYEVSGWEKLTDSKFSFVLRFIYESFNIWS